MYSVEVTNVVGGLAGDRKGVVKKMTRKFKKPHLATYINPIGDNRMHITIKVNWGKHRGRYNRKEKPSAARENDRTLARNRETRLKAVTILVKKGIAHEKKFGELTMS